MSTITMNPVLARELKERVRSWRAPIIVTLYLVVISLALFFTYETARDSGADSAAIVGRKVFEWVIVLMLLLVLFLVPGLTAGSICGERERQTLVPLQVSMLRPHSILFGKVSSALAFVFLLLFSTMPILGMAYLLGGIRITDILAAMAALFVVATLVGLLCASMSTFFKRVQSATVASYGVVLFLLLGTGAGYVVIRDVLSDTGDAPVELLYVNPAVAVADVVENPAFRSDGPLSDRIDGIDARPSFGNTRSNQSLWSRSLVVSTTLVSLMTVLAVRRLRAPGKTER